jgi:hypothetical protein
MKSLYKKHVIVSLITVIALLIPTLIYALQPTPQFLCGTPHGYGTEVNPRHYLLDLQCQPMLPETLEIPPGASARFTVNLTSYYAATARNNAAFDIHLAMDRARITVREADALDGEDITDTFAALQDVFINTSEQSYTFVIENRGLRSAVLDVSVRVRD